MFVARKKNYFPLKKLISLLNFNGKKKHFCVTYLLHVPVLPRTPYTRHTRCKWFVTAVVAVRVDFLSCHFGWCRCCWRAVRPTWPPVSLVIVESPAAVECVELQKCDYPTHHLKLVANHHPYNLQADSMPPDPQTLWAVHILDSANRTKKIKEDEKKNTHTKKKVINVTALKNKTAATHFLVFYK